MKCPHCGKDICKLNYKECIECGKTIVEFEGYYFKSSPIIAILEHFEKLVSRHLSKETNEKIIFRVKRKGLMWRYECARAKQLLAEADYDLDLLLETLTYLSESNKYSWRFKDTLGAVLPMINAGISIIKSKRDREALKEEKAKVFDSYLDERGDILNV
jgi:hypothetical protein